MTKRAYRVCVDDQGDKIEEWVIATPTVQESGGVYQWIGANARLYKRFENTALKLNDNYTIEFRGRMNTGDVTTLRLNIDGRGDNSLKQYQHHIEFIFNLTGSISWTGHAPIPSLFSADTWFICKIEMHGGSERCWGKLYIDDVFISDFHNDQAGNSEFLGFRHDNDGTMLGFEMDWIHVKPTVSDTPPYDRDISIKGTGDRTLCSLDYDNLSVTENVTLDIPIPIPVINVADLILITEHTDVVDLVVEVGVVPDFISVSEVLIMFLPTLGVQAYELIGVTQAPIIWEEDGSSITTHVWGTEAFPNILQSGTSSVTAVVQDTRNVWDLNTGGGGGSNVIYAKIGTGGRADAKALPIPSDLVFGVPEYSVEFEVKHPALGLATSGTGVFEILISNNNRTLSIRIGSNGFFLFNSIGSFPENYTQAGNGLVQLNVWQKWRVDYRYDGGNPHCDVFLNDVMVGNNISLGKNSGNNGQLIIRQDGGNSERTFLNYLRIQHTHPVGGYENVNLFIPNLESTRDNVGVYEVASLILDGVLDVFDAVSVLEDLSIMAYTPPLVVDAVDEVLVDKILAYELDGTIQDGWGGDAKLSYNVSYDGELAWKYDVGPSSFIDVSKHSIASDIIGVGGDYEVEWRFQWENFGTQASTRLTIRIENWINVLSLRIDNANTVLVNNSAFLPFDSPLVVGVWYTFKMVVYTTAPTVQKSDLFIDGVLFDSARLLQVKTPERWWFNFGSYSDETILYLDYIKVWTPNILAQGSLDVLNTDVFEMSGLLVTEHVDVVDLVVEVGAVAEFTTILENVSFNFTPINMSGTDFISSIENVAFSIVDALDISAYDEVLTGSVLIWDDAMASQ